MNRRQVLLDIMSGLSAQGYQRASTKDGACSYRLEIDGELRKCAIGQILPDEVVYAPVSFLDVPSASLQSANWGPTSQAFAQVATHYLTLKYGEVSDDDYTWLQNMQAIHDTNTAPDVMREIYELELEEYTA